MPNLVTEMNGEGRAIMHDPETFPEPDKFVPERFLSDGQLNQEVLDPAEVVFGFGRRCVNVTWSVALHCLNDLQHLCGTPLRRHESLPIYRVSAAYPGYLAAYG